jgi:hypothetical protein
LIFFVDQVGSTENRAVMVRAIMKSDQKHVVAAEQLTAAKHTSDINSAAGEKFLRPFLGLFLECLQA